MRADELAVSIRYLGNNPHQLSGNSNLDWPHPAPAASVVPDRTRHM
jgi:hypothetical protein